MRGLWRARFQDPDHTSGNVEYLISGRLARTGNAACAMAQDRHAEEAASRERWRAFNLVELTLLPALRSQERAVAWVALQKSGAITEHGWPLAVERGGRLRDESWRIEVGDLHRRLRERIVGFGESLADIVTALPEEMMRWAVEPHTDRFGRVDWILVRDSINRGGMSWVWQTPYGMAWIDQG
ncbi:hypothetical protein ACIBL5_05980 [Streptomyces sp. NPDC050516]|uniref:hypothetical protein n=1 Tax=Streptomyces sp. NPDC050516 TaxID=3365621 RepID=UPI00379DFB31